MSNPNKEKETFKISRDPAPLEIDKEAVQPADYTRDDLLRAMGAHMAEPPPVYVPPAPTARQSEQTRLEMEAGAKRVAAAEAQKAFRPPAPVEPASTPVFRPGDHVPNMQSKDLGARNVK